VKKIPKQRNNLGQFVSITCPHGIIPTRNCKHCGNKSQKEYYQRHKERINSKKKEYLNRNPEKRRAHNFVLYHKLPLTSECELCPDDEKQINLQRHHPNYDYPEIYVTVCPPCHHYADRTTEEI